MHICSSVLGWICDKLIIIHISGHITEEFMLKNGLKTMQQWKSWHHFLFLGSCQSNPTCYFVWYFYTDSFTNSLIKVNNKRAVKIYKITKISINGQQKTASGKFEGTINKNERGSEWQTLCHFCKS